MGDRQAPSGSQENLSGHGGDPDGRDSALRVGGNTYNIIGHIENANFGPNHGTIVNGSGSCEPVDEWQYVAVSELDTILSPITDASYTRNRKISPPDSDCFPGTREGVIQGITDWADSPVLFNPDAPHVFWTHGYVGCGKSSISQAVSQKYGGKGRLLGSFFFYRNSGDRSRMVRFAVTLASQMMAAVPATKSFYKAAVKADPTLLTRGASLSTQMERLVYKPFNAAVKRGLIFKTLVQGPFLVVVDGLDECEDKEEVKEFIINLLDFFKRHPSIPLRFFITSRVEQHIKGCLNTAGVQLDDLVAHGSEDDILTFLETSFAHRVERDPVLAAYVQSNGQWPTRADLKTLVRHIGGSFIFASALFKYIVERSDDGLNPMTRLPLTLNMNPGLDGLYAFTLARSQRLPHFSDVIYTIARVFEPLSITAIAELLGIQTFEVLDVLVNLQAIIHIPGTDELPVTFCHTSFRDFLTTESRSGCFFAPPSHHLYLLYCCSLVQDKPEGENAAASYGIRNCENHFEKFARLSPSVQAPFLQTVDALYARNLAKSQNDPGFSDVLSTLALLFEPLSAEALAELLGIQGSQVSRILANLRVIIHIQSNTSLVTFRHPSLRDFLTTESRSGHFFVPPSYHLYLSYCCSLVQDKPEGENAAASYGIRNCENHAEKFARLPPSSVDAFYARNLAKSQNDPGFSDILSTLALLYEPLSAEGLTELLGIQGFHVSRILANLCVIIRIQSNMSLVTFRHPSLRDFLTTESRSGHFFVPPSYHRHLFYRCLDLRDEERAETPARAYSIAHLIKHLLDCLPSTGRELFLTISPFPPTLDAVYAHFLSKAQHLPQFSDIISMIALLIEPLSSTGIAELLSIKSSAVIQVVANLQPIIRSKRNDHSLYSHFMLRLRKSLCNFLATESRSGPFFVSPSYHLKISYCCLAINSRERQPNIETPSSLVTTYSWEHCVEHLNKFLEGTSEEHILEALEQLPHLPEQTLPVHLLSFTYILYWLFADYDYPRPKKAFHAVTRCIEFLAEALECDPQPDRWLCEAFSQLGLLGPTWATLFTRSAGYYFEIQQEQAMALQHIVECVETAIRAKYPSIFSMSQPYQNIEFCLIKHTYIGDHTPISAYRLFEWMNRRVQAVIAFDEPGTGAPYYFELKISGVEDPESYPQTRITLHKRGLRSTNSRPEVDENGGV